MAILTYLVPAPAALFQLHPRQEITELVGTGNHGLPADAVFCRGPHGNAAEVGIISYYYHSLDVHPGVNALQGLFLAAVSGPTHSDGAADLILKLEALPSQGDGPVENGLELAGNVSKIDRRGDNDTVRLLESLQYTRHIIALGTGLALAAITAVVAKIYNHFCTEQSLRLKAPLLGHGQGLT